MNGRESLRNAIDSARESAEAAQTDAQQGTALRSDIEAELDRLRRGVGDPDDLQARLDQFRTLVDSWDYARDADVPEPFAALDVDTVDGLLDTLAEAYEAWVEADRDENEAARTTFIRTVRALRETFCELDADQSLETVDELTTAFYDRDTTAFEARVTDLRTGFEELDIEDLDQVQWRISVRYQDVRAALDRERLTTALDSLEPAAEPADRTTTDQHLKQLGNAARALESFADLQRCRLDVLNATLAERYSSDPADPLPVTTDTQPALLLPVRLETRFESVDGEGETNWKLLVRTYPDDVHVDTHESGLTDDELQWGIHFWKQVWWWATTTDPTNVPEAVRQYVDVDSLPKDAKTRFEAIKERVWAQLVERYGAERAAWVKRALAPDHADELLGEAPVQGVPKPDFEALASAAERRPDSWTRPPRARLLPDRWVAFAHCGDDVVTSFSEPIREPLAVGPDPDVLGSHSGSAHPDDSKDAVDTLAEDGMKWMFDFDAAKTVGMGLEVPLTEEHVDAGIDRLVVVGVKTGMDDRTAAAHLRELLDAHHYTEGLEFLAQGTPSNNTLDEPSGYSSTENASTTLPVECDGPLVEAGDESDGAIAARLLGVDPDQLGTSGSTQHPVGEHVFAHVRGADGSEQLDARHMNAALWSATWGYYVPHMLLPTDFDEKVDDAGQADLDYQFVRHLEAHRQHFVNHVRARGPVPALRVGEQPYGVLPVTDLDEMAAADGPTADADVYGSDDVCGTIHLPAVEGSLAAQVQRLRAALEGGVDAVPTVMDEEDPVEAFTQLTSMEATANDYRLRDLLGKSAVESLLTGAGIADVGSVDPNTLDESTRRFLQELRAASEPSQVAATMSNVTSGVPSALLTPRIAHLLFRDQATGPVDPLVDEQSPAFMQSLQETPASSLRYGPPAPAGADLPTNPLPSSVQVLAVIMHLSSDERTEPLLDRLLYYALLQEYLMARARLGYFCYTGDDTHMEEHGRDVWDVIPESEHYDDEFPTTVWSKVDQRAPHELLDALAELSHVDESTIDESTSYAEALFSHPEIDDAFADVQQALGYLQDVDGDDLETLLTETLDLASHRLDAWATSLATRRLTTIREHQTAAESGIRIGAYGVVENLEPSSAPKSAGHVHAPSLPQATTAAVLRSGYQSHRGTERGDLLEVDLSAERVREAEELIEGVRQGQPLGALLGYRFERELHEHTQDLDMYIAAFRVLAPFVAGKLPRDDDGTAAEPVATREVVDGVALNQLWNDDAIPWGTKPGADTAKLPQEPDPNHTAITDVLDLLDDQVDAVRDVLTAEGLHQLLNGNPTRAGGSVDALSRGEAPQDLDMTRTPRTGIGVTHRVLVLFDGDGDSTPAWTPSPDAAVRAAVEPNLNAFVGDLFGAPERVRCLVEYDVEAPAPDNDSTEDESERPRETTVVRLSDLALSPLDVLYLEEGEAETQRSEIEQRIVYHLYRDGPATIAPDGDVTITFGPFDEWDGDLDELGVDPSIHVSFGELLEVARTARELVTGGRAADASDLALPDEAADATYGSELGSRATDAHKRLQDIQQQLEAIVPLFKETGGHARPIDTLDDLVDAVVTASTAIAQSDLDSVEGDLASLSATGLVADLTRLHEVRTAGITLSAIEGEVLVRPESGQRILGWTTARPGQRVRIEIEASTGRVDAQAEARVREDGHFEADVDCSGIGDGTTFTVRARVTRTTQGRPSEISVPGRAVQWYQPEWRLDEWLPHLRRLSTVSDQLESFSNASSELRTVWESLSTPSATTDGAPFENAVELALQSLYEEGDEMRVAVETLLTTSITLPGFDSGADELAIWRILEPILEAVAGKTPPSEEQAGEYDILNGFHDPAVRAEVQQALDSLLGHLTAEVSEFDTLLDVPADLTAPRTDGLDALRDDGVEELRDGLFRASYFGIHGAIPLSATGSSADDVSTLATQASSAGDEIADRVSRASAALPIGGTDPTLDQQLDRLEALLGESFVVLPPFQPANGPELQDTFAPSHNETLQNGDVMNVETWFQRAARVREQPRTLQRAFTYGETFGDFNQTRAPRMQAGQLPYRDPDTWIGLSDEWADRDDDARIGGRLSLVAHLYDNVDASGTMAGFFVDEWVETVPRTTETTGLSFHFDRPNSRAPQSMLLAVPPTDDGWNLQALADIVEESLELAKLRTADPEALSETGLGHLLPALCFAENSRDDSASPDSISINLDELRSFIQQAFIANWEVPD
ncbi:BGTF surface domain-containing protein [Natrinema gelatinilyticum]|uniref:BGTF surface domain-containing protein n=1 Tax=Natrinema gelatinilyticum TaxID=2961571 RepID=UPI0020C25C24|nr:BGTF surface domain-containing protein [Natrinema gelatinilyticum]